MASERIQRRIEAFLDEADAAASAGKWRAVAEKARAVLAIDEANEDARAYLKMAQANGALESTERRTDLPQERSGKFTQHARIALTLAQEEAYRFNHNYIGTEHILLGLIRDVDGTAAKILTALKVEPHKARAGVEFVIGRGDQQVSGKLDLTPRSKEVIELAVDEARRTGNDHIGTEHLLVGLVVEGTGIAAGVLESLGASAERVRAEAMRLSESQPREA